MRFWPGDKGLIIEGDSQAEYCQLKVLADELEKYSIPFGMNPTEFSVEPDSFASHMIQSIHLKLK